MTDGPGTESSHTETHTNASGAESASNVVPRRGSDALRWFTYAALALAVIAVALAALAYFHPAHNRAAVAQQAGDAKLNVCSAYKTAHKSVVINTHMQSKNPDDAVADLAVAINARLALIGGGAYLSD